MAVERTKSKFPPKSGSAGSGPAAPETDAQDPSRNVKFDDRGNAIWDWSVSTGSFSYASQDSTQPLKKLEHPALSLIDDAPAPNQHVKANPLGAKKGYDPYDSGQLARTTKQRKRDLRKLGEWLKIKKQVQAKDKK
jgi:hypothetical protein